MKLHFMFCEWKCIHFDYKTGFIRWATCHLNNDKFGCDFQSEQVKIQWWWWG